METDEFDMLTLGDKTYMLKLLLPYIDYDKQMWLALFIRIMEFRLTLQFYSSKDCPFREKRNFSMDSIFKEIKPKCPPQYAKMLDNMNMLMNMSAYMDIFSKAEDIMSAFNTSNADNENEVCAGGNTGGNNNKKAKENGGSKNFDVSPVNMLKGMMSPKQLELFNQYNDMLNN